MSVHLWDWDWAVPTGTIISSSGETLIIPSPIINTMVKDLGLGILFRDI
jgi:hypothetical protein